MQRKHNEIKRKPVDINVIVIQGVLFVSLGLVILVDLAEYPSHLDVKQEKHGRENIKVIPVDLHDDPAIGQILLIMVDLSEVEIEEVELLVEYTALIEEYLARSQDEADVFTTGVIQQLLKNLHESDPKVDKSNLIYQVLHRFILFGVVFVVSACIDGEVAPNKKRHMQDQVARSQPESIQRFAKSHS